eukprot:3944880-Pyramimonas_sp.AAC.1
MSLPEGDCLTTTHHLGSGSPISFVRDRVRRGWPGECQTGWGPGGLAGPGGRFRDPEQCASPGFPSLVEVSTPEARGGLHRCSRDAVIEQRCG